MRKRDVALVGALLLSACGSDQSAAPTISAPTPGTSPAAIAPERTLRTAETPWWQWLDDPAPPSEPAEAEPIDEQLDLASDVLFEVGSSQLSPAADSQLHALARLLLQHPGAEAATVGHTDSTPGPSDDFNLLLSLQRADAVQTWLVAAGVEPSRISTDGRGATEPVASNDTALGRAANRRVSIRVWEES